jgi:hypothetical protein
VAPSGSSGNHYQLLKISRVTATGGMAATETDTATGSETATGGMAATETDTATGSTAT